VTTKSGTQIIFSEVLHGGCGQRADKIEERGEVLTQGKGRGVMTKNQGKLGEEKRRNNRSGGTT